MNNGAKLFICVVIAVIGAVTIPTVVITTSTNHTKQDIPTIISIASAYDTAVDNETALEHHIDNILTNESYCCNDDLENKKIVIEQRNSWNAYDVLNSQIILYLQSTWNNGNVPLPMSKALALHINQTLHNLKKEFTDHPFITTIVYSPTQRQNKIIDTFTGNIVLNDSGQKVFLKPDGTQIHFPDDIPLGTWLKVNYVLHNVPCGLTAIKLSNQSNSITTGNLTDIIVNPTKHGLMDKASAEHKFWKFAYITPNCDTQSSYTYELVESHAR